MNLYYVVLNLNLNVAYVFEKTLKIKLLPLKSNIFINFIFIGIFLNFERAFLFRQNLSTLSFPFRFSVHLAFRIYACLSKRRVIVRIRIRVRVRVRVRVQSKG